MKPTEDWLKELSFDQSMAWVLNCFEIDLNDYYFRYTYAELVGQLKLKIAQVTSERLQFASTLMHVASMALGGGEKKERIVSDVSDMNRIMRGE